MLLWNIFIHTDGSSRRRPLLSFFLSFFLSVCLSFQESESKQPGFLLPFHLPKKPCLHISLPRPLKEKPHDKNLQPRHGNHQPTLHNAEMENPRFRAPHRAEIPILPCPEVLLVAVDGRQLSADFENGFF